MSVKKGEQPFMVTLYARKWCRTDRQRISGESR